MANKKKIMGTLIVQDSATVLYRHFDKDGELLYIGISHSVVSRTSQHYKHSFWFKEVRNITVTWYETRDLAVKAEKDAIINENPKYNTVGSIKGICIDWLNDYQRMMFKRAKGARKLQLLEHFKYQRLMDSLEARFKADN